MNLITSIQTMFKVPEGHTPKVLLGGGTEAKMFMKIWDGQIPDETLQKLDEAASVAKLPLNPFLVLLVQGEDGHIHAQTSLPLVKWTAEIHVEDSVSESKELIRITDWCAGFMQSFCANGTVAAYDLLTEMILLGEDNNPAFSIKASVKGVAPQREVRELSSFADDIGNVDEILGQMSSKQIKKAMAPIELNTNPIGQDFFFDMFKEKGSLPAQESGSFKELSKRVLGVKDASPEPVSVPIVNVDAEQRKVQQDIVDKYGMEALKDILSRSKQPLLVDDSSI